MSYEQCSIVKRIAEDLELMKDGRKIIKASFLDKLGIKNVPPEKLHANPDDEFSDPNIGPNESIITNYSAIARKNQCFDLPVFPEPIVVNKLSGGEYLILNGHHRWAAALEANVPKVRIRIVDTKY